MPNDIDTRIVEMEFDNTQFERGAKTTLTTLDNLKHSLDFEGAEKGFDSLATALSKMDFGSGISSSMEIGIQSMSKFQAFTFGVFEEIGRKITNLGTSIANELLFAQKKAGFEEYELELGSVQTIQASTGKDFKEIYGYLAELNKYADRTIYSFRDMTTHIGKFTNAGVDLDDAVKAIQGISNEAALSGANAQEASRAMYNFSQALSAGYVKLIDWKSIENANMATVEFKRQLIDTALELGTVVKEGDKYLSTTTDMNGKISAAFDATANFNDSLSAQWMTSEVLTKTLAKYSNETTDIGKRAYSAAQDVKSFSQMICTLKEAIGSGWAETFRLIFGEFEDAKKLWSGVSNVLGGVIDRFSDLRNHALRYWKQEGGRTKLLNSLIRLWKIFSERIGIVEKSFSAAFPVINKLGNVLTSITNRFQKFTISLKKGLLGNQESLDIFRNRTDRVFHGLRALIKAVREIASAFATVFKTALKSANEELEGTRDITEIFESIALHIFHAAKAIKNWVTESSRLQALSVIFKGIVAVGELIVEIFKQVYSTFRPVVKETSNSEPTFLNLIAKIAELVIRFKDFITETKIVEKAIRKIIDVVKNLKPLLDGFKEGFSFFKDKEFAKGLKSIGDGFKNLFSSIFSGFGKSKDTTNTAKKEVKNIANSTGSVYGKLVDIFKKFLNSIKNLFNKFKNAISGLFGGIGDTTKNAGKETERQATGLTFVAQKLLEYLSKAVDKLKPLGEQLKNSIANIFGGFNKSSKKASKDADEAAERPVSMIDNFIAKAKELLHKINEGINVTAITETIGEGLKKVWIGLTEDPLLTALVGGWLQIIQIAKTVVSPIKSFSENIDTLTDGAKRSMDATTGFVNSLKSSVDEWKKAKTAEMFRDIAVAMLLVAASVALITYAFSKDGAAATVGLGAVVGLMIEMSAIVKGLSKAFPNPVDLSKATSAMLKMAIALLIMSKAIAAIAKAGQDGNMPSLIVAISGLILIMYAMAGLIKTLLKSTSDLGKSRRGVTKTMKMISTMFIALAIALWIISKPVKSLAKLSWEQLARGMAGVVALLGVLAGYMAIISKLKLKPDQLSTSMTFIYSLAFALTTLAGIVGTFGKMDSESLTSGLIGVTAITGILLIFLYAMGQTLKDVKPKVISSAASATIMIAIAIRILASAIKSLSDLSFSEMGPALAAIGLALAGIVVALIALAKLGGGGGSMVLAATALLITAVALQAITAAVKKMEDIKWDKVKGGLLAVGLVAAGLVVLSFFAEPMIALAGAFAIFGAGVLLVGTGVKRIGKGIQLFVKSILSLVGAWPMIKTVIGEAIEFAVGYFPMVATKLVEAIKVFTEKIIETAPTIAKAIGALVMATFESFYGWIPDIVDEAIKIVKHVLKAFENNADDIFSSLFSIIISLLTKLEENMPKITELLGNIVFDALIGSMNVVETRIGELAEKLFSMVVTLIDTLATLFDDEHVDTLIESMDKLWDNTIDAAFKLSDTTVDKLRSIGPTIITHIVTGIKKKIGRINRTIDRGIKGALSIADDRLADAAQVGKDLIDGLIKGLKAKWEDVKEEVELFGESVLETLQSAFGIASPSKETMEQGKYLDLGLAKGIKQYTQYATKAGENTAKEVTNSFANMSVPSFDTGMDIYPVVTPVLNSKNLEDGAAQIQGMFTAMDEQDVGFQFPSYIGTVSADMSSETASTLNASVNDETRQLYEELKTAVDDLTEMLSNVTIISDEATIAASVDLDGKKVGELMLPVVDAKMTDGARKAKTKTAQ